MEEKERSVKGKVYLVGAGPGDPGLITGKGLRKLRCCDAVVYDSLASDLLLAEVKKDCRKIYVGKRAGCHSMKQEEINQLLVELAEEGLTVVRLKGGDPFVFGRGGEEVMTLKQKGIGYEVISGVTSAVAALASVGIPVTHRAMSRSFHVMTGHTLSEEGSLPPDFDAFARLDGTLIFLMGLGNLSVIVKGLIEQGKSKELPAAVLQNGTLPEQKVVRGTLENIEERVKEAGIESPAIIVAGEVASLDFSRTIREPLEGCRIGMTGTDAFTQKLEETLARLGGSGERLMTLGVESHCREEAMKSVYENLAAYTWIVFTSANAVREFFRGLWESKRDFRAVGNVKFAVVGKGTARELKQYGFKTDYMPERYQVSDLAAGLEGLVTKEDRLLIPRSAGGSRELNEVLDRAGISYDDIVLYDVVSRSYGAEDMKKALKEKDYVTFASASGVEAFFDGSDEEIRECLAVVKVVCIGDITAQALLKQGRKADIVAEVFSAEGMAEAICLDWNRERSGGE